MEHDVSVKYAPNGKNKLHLTLKTTRLFAHSRFSSNGENIPFFKIYQN
jgi:hypothetical protein